MDGKLPGTYHELLVSLPSPCSSGSGLLGGCNFSLAVSAEIFKGFGNSIHKLRRHQQIHGLIDVVSRDGLSFSTILRSPFGMGTSLHLLTHVHDS